jgi:hypothetical protein
MIGSFAIFFGCGTKGVPSVMLDREKNPWTGIIFDSSFQTVISPHGRESPRFLTPWKS